MRLIRYVAIIVLIALAVYVKTYMNIADNDIVITKRSGFVAVEDADRHITKEIRKRTLNNNDKIITGDKSRIDILINKSAAVRVKGNSEVSVSIDKSEDSVAIKLDKGVVLNKIMKKVDDYNIPLSEPSKFTVETPTMVASVRGTRFMVSYTSNESKIVVTRGSVGFKPINGNASQIITKGQKAVLDSIYGQYQIRKMSKQDFSQMLEINSLGIRIGVMSIINDLLFNNRFINIIKTRLTVSEMQTLKHQIAVRNMTFSSTFASLNQLGLSGGDHRDSWNNPYLYKKVNNKLGRLISFGPDGMYDTVDDIIVKISISRK
ncbi:sigma factor regulatory protein, FecR/PupR family [Candidatus Magnetoovum chiemensis]|nr:sigma factor regulatory protein, FecR/PupR family [Candidatus Magnetoovum chiemensis]